MTAPTLTPQERAAARAALSRSIKARERELARLGPYVKDPYLERVRERLGRELAELRAKRDRLDVRKAPQLPDLASRYLGENRDPRRSQAQAEARDRAIARREAGAQTREQLRQAERCRHGDLARLCPACNSYPIEEVPF